MLLIGWPLGGLALAAIALGLVPLGWILKRMGAVVLGRPRRPAGALRYLLALLVGGGLVGGGLAALGLVLELRAWRALTAKSHVAEVQCLELGPRQLRLYYVPIDGEGARGATETYDLAGDEWTVGGEVLRFRPELSVLGIETVHRISRVQGRWSRAADANAHRGTAFDRFPPSRGWRALYRDADRPPLSWAVAGAHGQAVSQLPDRRAVYDLYVTPNGLVVDKRRL